MVAIIGACFSTAKMARQTERSIYLHADEISIDGGSLIFKSAGRRPAGTEPNAKEADSTQWQRD